MKTLMAFLTVSRILVGPVVVGLTLLALAAPDGGARPGSPPKPRRPRPATVTQQEREQVVRRVLAGEGRARVRPDGELVRKH